MFLMFKLPLNIVILILLMISPEAGLQAQVKIIGHRGASFLAPENTVSAANLAWKNGADAVEVDIRLSADGKIVCSHDASTKRTSGIDLIISETNSKVLRKLDVGSFKDQKYKGEKLSFLKEIIKTVPAGKELVIELKCGTEVLPELEWLINKYEKRRNFVFISFDLPVISETKKTFPGYSSYWLCSNKDLLGKNIGNVPDSGLEGVSLSFNIIDEDIMKRATSLGLEVYSWTVDDPAEAKRLITLGIKGITTNRPGWLNSKL